MRAIMRILPATTIAALCRLACLRWSCVEGRSFVVGGLAARHHHHRHDHHGHHRWASASSFVSSPHPPRVSRRRSTGVSSSVSTTSSSNGRAASARRKFFIQAASSDEPNETVNEELYVPPAFPKNEDDTTSIKNTLMTNVMFQSLPDTTLDKLVLAFERVTFDKGEDIITQGDTDIDYCYVLSKGQCDVTIDGKKLPYPAGVLTPGTVFGELGMLYDEARAATVLVRTDTCTLYRADRKTFRYFLDRQAPTEIEDVKKELRVIDAAIDKIAGVKTRYCGSIIYPYKPQRNWLWRRWKGTVFQHAYKGALFNMAVTAAIALLIGRRPDCTWNLAISPDSAHPIIARMNAFGKHWRYLQSITIFILTFFLSQSYTMWRETYTAARKIQGRLNDIGFLVASTATRDENGQYTPEARSAMEDIGLHVRLFHAFTWAKYSKKFAVLLTPRGMSRMLSRGLMTQKEFNLLSNDEAGAGACNICFEWMTIRALKGREDGGLSDADGSMKCVLLGKMCELSAVYLGVGSILDGRIPLAYTHIVQILVDSFLMMAPIALYAELGVWSIMSVGMLTMFYSGLLDLAKIFLDPLDNDDFCNESINMDIGVLVRESNGGSTRWKDGAATLPF